MAAAQPHPLLGRDHDRIWLREDVDAASRAPAGPRNFRGRFFPAIILLLSTWYVRYDLQKRYAGYYLLGMVASAFSGILAYGFTKMDGVGGLAGWRWIFVMEGILTCIVAFVAYTWLLEFPDQESKTAPRFGRLSEADCKFTIERLN